ncbi:MAG: diadenylate cyclase CdaA [Candidatus Sumerlaeaceae bacterium]|nr:diadenylate cyclase CdaA [Candidatus Sumerlaeaceae bacterium]
MRLHDIADILVVTMLVYTVLAMIRETRSPAAMRGLLGVIVGGFFIYTVAKLLNLTTTTLLFEQFWVVIILIFLIVFQNEFRKALTDLGQLWVFRRLFARGGAHMEDLVKAVRSFSRQKVGALICIERRNPLKMYADTGTPIDGLISNELLRTIFVTYSPLHDGAVIVRGDRIVAAGCILPLSDTQTLGKDLGTRHRAALGLSEETDAAIVVVSEETGIISLAVRGRLERHFTQETLREALQDLLDVKDEEETTND